METKLSEKESERDEFDRYTGYMCEGIEQAVKNVDVDIKIQVSKLVKTLQDNDIPPDSVTAKALLVIAESLTYAVEKLGKDPDICKTYRVADKLRRIVDKDTNTSAWGE